MNYKNLCSLPCRRFTIFLWCLKKISAPIISNVKNRSTLKKNEVITAIVIALNEAREEYLKIKNTTIQANINIKAIGILSAINTPKVVATPFPPLNFSQIGNMCPKTAKIADTYI